MFLNLGGRRLKREIVKLNQREVTMYRPPTFWESLIRGLGDGGKSNSDLKALACFAGLWLLIMVVF